MPKIEVNPIILKNVLLKLGASAEYQKHVSSVEFVPSATSTIWKGLDPDAVFTDVAKATWMCNLAFAQDWQTANSLSRYLYDNEGQKVPAVFEPQAGGTGFTAELVITPGSIGGAVDSTAVATVSLGVQGRPVLVPAAPSIPVISGSNDTTGPIAGGDLIKVTGTGFTGTSAVVFGTVNAPEFTVESDSVLYVSSPAAAAGSKPIKVTNAVGQSTTTAAYTYA